MAVVTQVPKLALIRIAQGAGALADFGYTRAGSEIEKINNSISVPSDEHGGDEGPEVDAQALPPTYIIRLNFTKFEKSVFEQLESAVSGGTAGVFAAADIGALYVGGTKYFRVLISTGDSSWVRNFPYCRPIDAQAYNLGTRFVEGSVSFQAIRNLSSGVIWNTTTA